MKQDTIKLLFESGEHDKVALGLKLAAQFELPLYPLLSCVNMRLSRFKITDGYYLHLYTDGEAARTQATLYASKNATVRNLYLYFTPIDPRASNEASEEGIQDFYCGAYRFASRFAGDYIENKMPFQLSTSLKELYETGRLNAYDEILEQRGAESSNKIHGT